MRFSRIRLPCWSTFFVIFFLAACFWAFHIAAFFLLFWNGFRGIVRYSLRNPESGCRTVRWSGQKHVRRICWSNGNSHPRAELRILFRRISPASEMRSRSTGPVWGYRKSIPHASAERRFQDTRFRKEYHNSPAASVRNDPGYLPFPIRKTDTYRFPPISSMIRVQYTTPSCFLHTEGKSMLSAGCRMLDAADSANI